MTAFLDPKNADVLYANLKASVAKLPPAAQSNLSPLVDSLAPLINNSAPELEGVLPSYIAAQKAILLRTTQPTNSPTKRRQTPISKLLGEVVAYANNLATFTNDDGDAVLEQIILAVTQLAESL